MAEAQKQLGLQITDEQIAEMRAHVDDIDFSAAETYEKQFRHDVMAHIHTFGDAAPSAKGIIHLGATSQFVNCNTELLQIRESLQLIAGKIARVVDALGTFALHNRDHRVGRPQVDSYDLRHRRVSLGVKPPRSGRGAPLRREQ